MRLLFLLAALLGWASPVLAGTDAERGPVLAAPVGPSQLFVELIVNGQAHGALAELVEDGDRLLIDRKALGDAGIAVPRGVGEMDVANTAGIRATYDAAGQRLLLDVDPALLPLRRIAAIPREAVAPTVDGGVVLNYDLFVQQTRGGRTASLSTEQRVFGRFGTLTNSGVLSLGGAGKGIRYVRLDTLYRHVDEARALELTAGDLITRALSWSTAVRIGGVELSRNFALRPDLITVPLPSFAGEASVPTGVDLFINGYRESRTDVAPGRFVLDAVPVVNGAGEARIVTTDAVGRQIATVVPFYVAPDLLRPGLTDFALAGGLLRKGYGLDNFRYGRPVLSGSVRRGMTAQLTVSAHGEGTGGMAGAGIGAAWSPGLWGAVSSAVAFSEANGRIGRQLTLGYSYTGRRVSVGAEHVERSASYTDLGGFDLGRFAGSRRSDRISVSLPIRGLGSFGAGYVSARLGDGTRTRIASASVSVPLGWRASAFGAIDYDVGRHVASAQLRVVIPFGRRTVVSGGASRGPGGNVRLQASVARTAGLAEGLGYAADLAIDSGGALIGQASATLRSSRMQVDGGIATNGDERSAWGSVAGSLALLDGRLFAARSLPGAFAVVSTGMPRVPVYYENQQMGRTDRSGRLFVPNVVAYHPGRFAIDPLGLPLGVVAERTETLAALRAGTGGVVRLPVAFHRSATVRVIDAAGVPLAPGTLATLNGGATATVGWDGVLLIERLTGRVTLAAVAAGKPCSATVQIHDSDELMPEIGVVTCH